MNNVKLSYHPLVSVIMPTYNNASTLSTSINSVIKQSYKYLELIIVDDGSSDNTFKLLRKFQKRDKRIRVIEIKHKGAAKARNVGLNISRGDYIGFLDADDWYDTDFLISGINAIEKKQADVAIYDFYRVLSNGEKILNHVKTGIFNSYTACWNKLYKKNLWNNIHFPAGLTIEDLEVIPVVIGKGKKRIKIKGVYYNYLNRDNSITNTPRIGTELELKKALKILNFNLKRNNIKYNIKSYHNFINEVVYWHLLSGINSTKVYSQKKMISQFLISCFKKDNGWITFDGSYRTNIKRNIIIKMVKLGFYKSANYLVNKHIRI